MSSMSGIPEPIDVLPPIKADDIVDLLTRQLTNIDEASSFAKFAATQVVGTDYKEFFEKLQSQLELSHELLINKISEVKKIG
jgi:hypothetical protein